MTTYRKACERCERPYTTQAKRQRFCSHRCAALRQDRQAAMSYARPPASYADEAQRTVAAAVVEARVARNLSQPELARKAGISPATLGRIEHGNIGYSVRSMAAVLEVLGLAVEVGQS